MKRTKYMQDCMNSTSEMVGPRAVLNTFSNPSATLMEAWEELIGDRVYFDHLRDHSEACELIDFVRGDDPTMPILEAAKKVAHLITESKIEAKSPA